MNKHFVNKLAFPTSAQNYCVLGSTIGEIFSVISFTGRGWLSDILFPYRSPSPRPHPDPTQHPEVHPKRTQNRPETEPNGAETEPNGAEMERNQAFRGGTGGGFVGVGGGGGL